MNAIHVSTHRVRLVLLVAIAAILGIPATDAGAHGGDAGLVHSCVNKFLGTIRIIRPEGACFHVEVPVDWPAMAPAGGFRIVDSQGLEIGVWTGFGNAFRKVEGLVLSLTVGPSGFQSFGGVVPFVWTGPDCTGDRFLEQPDVFTAPVFVQGSTGSFPRPPSASKLISSMSTFPEFGGCFNFVPPINLTVGEVGTIDLSPFVPPFRVE